MSLATSAVGIIEMGRKPSRVEAFFDAAEDLDFADELVRMGRAGQPYDPPLDPTADEILLADIERLASELKHEYASVCAAIDAARH